LFYFIYVYEIHQPYSLTSISFIHPLPNNLHTLYMSYSLVFHYYFQSQCSKGFLNVSLLWVYFTLVSSTPCITLPYPFASHPPFFNSFQYTSLYHPYILYLQRHNVLQYCWCSIILFSFPSFPKFHRVVPLLLTCSTYEFVYDYACFLCICLLWIYLPHMRENMWPLSF
jgi:hypothetical protein